MQLLAIVAKQLSDPDGDIMQWVSEQALCHIDKAKMTHNLVALETKGMYPPYVFNK